MSHLQRSRRRLDSGMKMSRSNGLGRINRRRQRSPSSFHGGVTSRARRDLRPFRVNKILFDDADRVFLQRLGEMFVTPPSAPAAFLGAGVSTAMGYPTWGTLLDRLHRLAFGKVKGTGARGNLAAYVRRLRHYEDVTWRAQEYRDAIANEPIYLRFLKRQFRR